MRKIKVKSLSLFSAIALSLIVLGTIVNADSIYGKVFNERDNLNIENAIKDYNEINKEVLLKNTPIDMSEILDSSFFSDEYARQRCITYNEEDEIPTSYEYSLEIKEIIKNEGYAKVILTRNNKKTYPGDPDVSVYPEEQCYVLVKNGDAWKIANAITYDTADTETARKIKMVKNIESLVPGSEQEDTDITRNSDWDKNEKMFKEKLDIFKTK